jgi:hypothetical protein
VLFQLLDPHSIDEGVGGLRLNETDGKLNSCQVRQLFDNRVEVLQCLAACLQNDVEL